MKEMFYEASSGKKGWAIGESRDDGRIALPWKRTPVVCHRLLPSAARKGDREN
jgi:hypothetical protein